MLADCGQMIGTLGEIQMDFSVFFYTYSTTAQTLAGAFGFMVAAVLYRIAVHAAAEPNIMKSYTGIVGGAKDADSREKAQEMMNGVIRLIYDEHEEVKRSLIQSLHWTGGTIIACFVLIPAQPALWWLSRETSRRMKLTQPLDQWLLWLPIIVIVWAAIYTIGTYFPLVRGVAKLRRPESDPGSGADRAVDPELGS